MKTVPRFLTLTKRWRRAEVMFLALWVALVVALEGVGRSIHSDFGDAVALGACLGLAGFTATWHRRHPLRFVRQIVQWLRGLRRLLAGASVEFGIDFRVSPALPSGLPPFFARLVAALAVAAVGLAFAHAWFPGPARTFLVEGSYTLYLMLIAVLWGALLAGTLLLLFMPLALLHDVFVKRRERGRGGVQEEVLCLFGLLTTLTVAALLVPPWVSLATATSCLAVCATFLLLPSRAELVLLWRVRGSGCAPKSLRWPPFALLQVCIAFLFSVCLVLLTRGDRLVGGTHRVLDENLWVTPVLGLIFSWAAAAGMGTFTYQVLHAWRLRRGYHKASRARSTLCLQGSLTRAERREVSVRARRAGWRVRFDVEAEQPGEVPLALSRETDPSRGAESPSFEELLEPWPRTACVSEFQDARLWKRLARRREIGLRRHLLRVIQRVFRLARSRRFQKGEGFWLGMQHWFVTGLTRDRAEEEGDLEREAFFDETIGPHYQKVLSWEARHEYARIATALGVDLLFVEDGVTFRRLRQVLEQMFEIYDIFGGQQRIEEKHFVGILGIRVVMHEFELDQPFRNKSYPEPDYEDIGRARVLHVFRDRGESEEPLDVPLDTEFLSAPRLVGFPAL